jgi:hypothetical protein
VRFVLLLLVGLWLNGIPLRVLGQDGQPLKVRVKMRNQKSVQGHIYLKDAPVILSVYLSDQDSMAIPVRMIRQIILEPEEEEKTGGITYFNNTSIGILTGRANSQVSYRSRITAGMVNGVKINTYFWPGIGISFDQFPEVTTLPIFLSIRGDLFDHSITPFYFFDMGTGPSWNATDQNSPDQETDAGLMWHLGGGIKIYSDSRINIMLAMGFKSQRVRFTRTLWNEQEETIDRNYKNFSFRIGVGF